MEREPVNSLLETTMQKIKEMIGANTIVGEPITTPDGLMLIPISKLTFAFAGGGTDFSQKAEKNGYGGGSGAGVNIIPVAFLAIKGDKIDLIYVASPPTSKFDKIIDSVPDFLEKIGDFLSNEKDKAE